MSQEQALEEGRAYKDAYTKACQKVFLRVQEHQHWKTEKGYKPLKGCLSKRCKTKCKHGFPKRCSANTEIVYECEFRVAAIALVQS